PIVLATILSTGEQVLLDPSGEQGKAGDDGLPAAARAAADRDESVIVRDGDREVFLHVFNPPLRMAIVGAVHIAQVLAPLARATGFDVTVIDPRRTFATAGRFPDVALVHEWPDLALERLGPDRRTAVVALTHDPKLDEPALVAALRSPAFYVGALGSRQTQARRTERLREKGIGDGDLGRIAAPIGLAIGARGPAEIAVSIIAQVIERLRKA
ncbi:MAG: XdhC family protein, partial [Candidatus Binatia bacterium]